jgi:hypothetical protein
VMAPVPEAVPEAEQDAEKGHHIIGA